MDRNAEAFYSEDMIDNRIPRSHWKRTFNHKTTFNVGDLVPFFADPDVIPASTIKNKTSIVLRQSTPKYPVMDNMYLDVFYFRVDRWRMTDKFKEILGENPDGAWAITTEYQMPVITNTGVYGKNDLATYLGIPQATENTTFMREMVNAYIDIYNNWFRDQNLIAPIQFDTSETNLTTDGSTTGVDIQHGFGLLKAAKLHDYFTSALPAPLKAAADNVPSLPIGTSAPVVGNGMTLGLTDGTNNSGLVGRYTVAGSVPMTYFSGNNSKYGSNVGESNGNMDISSTTYGITTDASKSGIEADLAQAIKVPLTAVRDQIAILHILENDGRFGSRYKEILRGHYGAIASDESLGVPEYLGGKREPVNITTVLQTSSTDEMSPLGQTGAMSETHYYNHDFTKSFSKHVIIMGILCVRTDKTYQQGIARKFNKRRRYDIYTPELAHISNQPIYNGEIYWTSTANTTLNDEVFGYKEAWAEIKFPVNIISGELSSLYAQSLDVWHYAEEYDSLPVLSQEWIEEPINPVDRTLLVDSDVANQFIADILVTQDITAPIPLKCTPGLKYL